MAGGLRPSTATIAVGIRSHYKATYNLSRMLPQTYRGWRTDCHVVAGHIACLNDVIVHGPHFDCLTARTAGGFGLAFLLPAAFGHNSDLDIVG